jgi:hypothetical protein
MVVGRPGAVQADESGDATPRHIEGHVIDGESFAVLPGEAPRP